MRGFAVAGVIWYQGEADAVQPNAGLYRKLLPGMINDWRRAFGHGDLPFLVVQLANYGKPSEQPAESNVAELRESQTYALRLPKTALVVAIDLGDVDIHSSNKKDVGERLALAARAVAYGESVEYSGPVYESMKIENHKIRVRFSCLGGGLLVRDGQPLRQFAIAGADRKFVRAKAEIEGDSVCVWSDTVLEPAAVRYAWADNPDGCNLYNRLVLPTRPFRTDSWTH
jgi:sialate O-acetylesterase